MNEYIEVIFRKANGTRLRVKRQTANGIEFDERDPITRTIGFQLNGRGDATKERMRRMALVKGWDLNQFKLNIAVEAGNVILRGIDPDAFPEGLYSLRVQIEEARTHSNRTSITIEHDGHDTAEVFVVEDERDVHIDLTLSDEGIKRVIDASVIDGQDGNTWLASTSWRATRKACALNLLASLRTRPNQSNALLDAVHRIYYVANDRAFMKVDRALLSRLEELAKDPNQPFYREGQPHAPVHEQLLNTLPEPPDVKAQFKGLLSFRGEGTPSLQMVVAIPPMGLPYTYADVDLDTGNPLQDLVGFVVHMGELLSGKTTNHLDMRKRLAKTKCEPFLYYTIV